MRKLIIIAIAFIAQIAAGQITKNLGDLDKLKVFDQINVELIPSSENKIEIEGERANEVEIVNKNGELKIRMSLKKLMKGEQITAKLYFKKLESIDASEGSTIFCEAVFKQTAIDIIVKEGAEIKLKLDVERAKIKSVTGGVVKISGEASYQDASLGTGGILFANDLNTSQTKVTITTGGEAQVKAKELVDAKVNAGGTVTIYGSPKEIIKKTVLGGTIEESK